MVQRLVITLLDGWRCFDSRSTTLAAITRIRRPPLLLLLHRWSTARLPATIVGRRDLLLSRHFGRPRTYMNNQNNILHQKKKCPIIAPIHFQLGGTQELHYWPLELLFFFTCRGRIDPVATTSKKKVVDPGKPVYLPDYFKVNCGFGG